MRDRNTGQHLSFRLTLITGGFLSSLRGEAEGRWPRRWSVDPEELNRAASGALTFEVGPQADSQAVADLLGMRPDQLGAVALRSPAAASDLTGLEAREAASVPVGVRDFLGVSDGLRSGDVVVLGVRDLYVVDTGNSSWWLVGRHVDSEHHYLCGSDGVAMVPEPRADPESLERVAPTYLAWVKSLVMA